jgi:signal transduction histidine kinase
MRGWHALGLRPRLTLLAVASVAAGLAIGGVVLVLALSAGLQRALDEEALETARDVAALVDTGRLPDPVPVAGTQLVQVVDAASRVRAGSPGTDRLVPLLRPAELARVRSGERFSVDGGPAGLNGPLRVLGVRAGGSDPQTVVVAAPAADVQRSVATLRTVLLVAYPLLVAGLAVLAWQVVGLTLRPQERARARQREFVSDAAHELRSPLASIRTQLEVGVRLGPGSDWPAIADDLLADVERLSRLVDDLLLLARADEAGPAPSRARPLDLRPVVDGVVARAAGARVPVRAEPGPASWAVADPDAVTRVLTNLVDNAVRHAATRVSVRAGSDGGQAVLAVADDGPGIAAADRQRAFERFSRLDGGGRGRQDGGAGLGLAIVAELVRRHGGTVRLADAGPGLLVEVRLPGPG